MAPSANDQLAALTPPQLAALSLLRAGLNPGNPDFFPNPTLFVPLSDFGWTRLRDFAVSQGFAAISYEALPLLPKKLLPSRQFLISWGMSAQIVKDRYNYFCSHALELENFFAKGNLMPVHMKGLSIAALYPRPELREFGDLDIFLIRKDLPFDHQDLWDNGKTGDEMIRKAGMKVSFSEYSPKHSSFDFNNMHVESHRSLLNIYTLNAAKPVDDELRRHLQPTRLQIADNDAISIVSPEFARIFIAFHALQHVGARLRIRHIADWAMFCRKYGNELPEVAGSEALRRGAASLSALSDIILGTDISAVHNEKVTATILHTILNPHRYEYLNLESNLKYAYTRSVEMYRLNQIKKVIFPGEPGFLSEYLTSLRGKVKRELKTKFNSN